MWNRSSARRPLGRDLVDTAFDRLLAPRLDVAFVLTVVEAVGAGDVSRAVTAGTGGTGRTVVPLSPAPRRTPAGATSRSSTNPGRGRRACSTARGQRRPGSGNKAVYRTRRALAAGAELVVLAPGVGRFGEDPGIDRLIRRHGYAGRAADPRGRRPGPGAGRLAEVMAHLIQGSPEGRFTVTYCTDPADGGLTADELAAVGYGWRHLAEEQERLGVDAATPTGPRHDAAGERFEHVARPALGLWVAGGPGGGR